MVRLAYEPHLFIVVLICLLFLITDQRQSEYKQNMIIYLLYITAMGQSLARRMLRNDLYFRFVQSTLLPR